jgi:hypothetical protein
MPLNAPQSLSNEQVHAPSGYVHLLNGLVATIGCRALTSLKVPKRGGFAGDPRPDVRSARCMKDGGSWL